MPRPPRARAEGLPPDSTIPDSKGNENAGRTPRARFAPEYEVLLGALIKLRKERGVTQAAMARAIGKTQSHVSMCESRERELSVMDLWKWCLALGLPLSAFMKDLEQEVTPALGEPYPVERSQ